MFTVCDKRRRLRWSGRRGGPTNAARGVAALAAPTTYKRFGVTLGVRTVTVKTQSIRAQVATHQKESLPHPPTPLPTLPTLPTPSQQRPTGDQSSVSFMFLSNLFGSCVTFDNVTLWSFDRKKFIVLFNFNRKALSPTIP